MDMTYRMMMRTQMTNRWPSTNGLMTSERPCMKMYHTVNHELTPSICTLARLGWVRTAMKNCELDVFRLFLTPTFLRGENKDESEIHVKIYLGRAEIYIALELVASPNLFNDLSKY